MDSPIDLGGVDNWPAALVAVVLVLALLVWPGVVAHIAARDTKKIRTTLTENNGGSTVLDRLESLQREQQDQGRRLARVEACQADLRDQDAVKTAHLARVERSLKRRRLFF